MEKHIEDIYIGGNNNSISKGDRNNDLIHQK